MPREVKKSTVHPTKHRRFASPTSARVYHQVGVTPSGLPVAREGGRYVVIPKTHKAGARTVVQVTDREAGSRRARGHSTKRGR